jgi:hypothetical protein
LRHSTVGRNVLIAHESKFTVAPEGMIHHTVGIDRGTPNKMTFMKTQMAMKAMAEADGSQQKATEMLNRIMVETYAMAREYGPLSNKYDDDLYKSYLKLTVYTAGKLAPYQTPMLATVKVGGDRDNPLMVREGATSKQVMEMLRQKMMETGLVPTMFKNGGSLINVAPQRMESQSG